MKASEYMNTFGVTRHVNTEDEFLQQLIRSHRNIREARLENSKQWQNLPEWKKWLCRRLGLVCIY